MQLRLMLVIGVILFLASRGTDPLARQISTSVVDLGNTLVVVVENRCLAACPQKSLLSRDTHSRFPVVRQREIFFVLFLDL